MDIAAHWKEIRKHFNLSFRSNFYVSIGSVDLAHNPTVTPIGSLFLNNNQKGFYFEKYPTKLPQHAHENNMICALAVNSNTWFWLKSLNKVILSRCSHFFTRHIRKAYEYATSQRFLWITLIGIKIITIQHFLNV